MYYNRLNRDKSTADQIENYRTRKIIVWGGIIGAALAIIGTEVISTSWFWGTALLVIAGLGISASACGIVSLLRK